MTATEITLRNDLREMEAQLKLEREYSKALEKRLYLIQDVVNNNTTPGLWRNLVEEIKNTPRDGNKS